MHRAPCVLRRLRIVRDHHDGLVELFVEPLEQIERLLRVPGVEIARRLVGNQDAGIGDDGAGNGHSLLLTA